VTVIRFSAIKPSLGLLWGPRRSLPRRLRRRSRSPHADRTTHARTHSPPLGPPSRS